VYPIFQSTQTIENQLVMSKSGIKVFAPATVANLGCGFDILGLALNEPGDEIIARKTESAGQVTITKITGAQGNLPYEPTKNTAGVAALAFLKKQRADFGLELEIHKKMPIGSGLGSSSASAVAAVVAANTFLKHPLHRRELLPFAIAGEKVASGSAHADNVAPALIGGIVLARDVDDIHRIIPPKSLYVVVIYPKLQILTSEARAMLSDRVSLGEHIQQSANLGGLILGFERSDFPLIKRSLKDIIIEPQRAELIPGFYDVKDAALVNGALGCSISGAGPSLFALCENTFIANNVAQAMTQAFQKHKIESTPYISEVNKEGAKIF